MLIVILVIFIIVFIIGWMKTEGEDGWEILMIANILGALICSVALIFLLDTYPYNVDEKIAMYEEENIKIEEKVRNSVKGYMDFENDTLKNLIDTSDLQTLLIKYPDLNSNELVKMEIETYKENSQKIKELKEKSVTRHYKAWWLYFGK